MQIGLACLVFAISSTVASTSVEADGGVVVAKGARFLAEVARTPAERAKGLMYRQTLKQSMCMFFVYDYDDFRSIWMKNCLISLDVAWIAEDGTVVEIVERVPPCSPMLGDGCPSYGGNVESRYFIEFAAGTFKRIGLKVGDKISWELKFSNGGSSKGGPPISDKPDSPPSKKSTSTAAAK